MLPFRHPDRDRVKPLHECCAAQASTARPETAADSRTVTNAEWSHLDPPSVATPELAEHGPKIEPPLGGEEDQRLAAGQGQPSLDAPHVETELAGSSAKKSLDLTLDMVSVLRTLPVFVRRQTNDPTRRSGPFSEDRQ
jgi:hypothetical protein